MSSPSNVTPKKSKRTVEPEAPLKQPKLTRQYGVHGPPVIDLTQEAAETMIDLTQAPEEIDLTSEDDEPGTQRAEEYKELMDNIEFQCSEMSGDDDLVMVTECGQCRKLKVPVCDLCTCGYDECTGEEKCDCEACQ